MKFTQTEERLCAYVLCRVGGKEFEVFGSRHAAQSWAEAQYQIKRWGRRGICKLVAVPA